MSLKRGDVLEMKSFVELIKEYFKGIQRIWSRIKSNLLRLFGKGDVRSNTGISWFDEMKKCNEKPKKKYPIKMDFSRKVLHSQVTCRKPKHLIKKVI